LNCFYFKTAEVQGLFSKLRIACWKIYYTEGCSNEKWDPLAATVCYLYSSS